MNDLDERIHRSMELIRRADDECERPALVWSAGKDSMALLHLVRRTLKGRSARMWPVLYVDTGRHFGEVYKFRDQVVAGWGLRLLIVQAPWSDRIYMDPVDPLACCHRLKTMPMLAAIDGHDLDGLVLGIRHDENEARAQEKPVHRYDRPNHARYHPLLHWTEMDVWAYTAREGLPVCPLYFAREGKRYRSLGCECCTEPIDSGAGTVEEIIAELETLEEPERAGRCQDKEDPSTMGKLRALGYM